MRKILAAGLAAALALSASPVATAQMSSLSSALSAPQQSQEPQYPEQGGPPLDSVTLSNCSGNVGEVRILEYEDEGVVAWEYSDTTYGIEPRLLRVEGQGVNVLASFVDDQITASAYSTQGSRYYGVKIAHVENTVQFSFPPGYARDLIDAHHTGGLSASATGSGGTAHCE